MFHFHVFADLILSQRSPTLPSVQRAYETVAMLPEGHRGLPRPDFDTNKLHNAVRLSIADTSSSSATLLLHLVQTFWSSERLS